MLDQLVELLTALAIIASGISVFMDSIKPAIEEMLPDDLSENVRYTILRVFRSIVAILLVAISGNATDLVANMPILSTMPDAAIIFMVGLVASFGSENIHILLDALRAFKDAREGVAAERQALGKERMQSVNSRPRS
jgi:hypothetical protein